MATTVLPGGVTKGVRRIKKPDALMVNVPRGENPYLCVVENGDCRRLPISKKVAEVLIARGMTYGD